MLAKIHLLRTRIQPHCYLMGLQDNNAIIITSYA